MPNECQLDPWEMYQAAIRYVVVPTALFGGHGYGGAYVYDELAPGRISVQSDPIGLAGGINAYSYVGGNPDSMIDHDGLFIMSTLGGPQRRTTLDQEAPLVEDAISVAPCRPSCPRA